MAIFGKTNAKDKFDKAATAAKTADDKKTESKSEAVATAEKKAEKKATRGPLAKEAAGRAHRVLVRPLVTEKTSRQEAIGQYQFIVAKNANKVEVAAAVRDLYGVKPVSVRIVNLKGKKVRFGRFQGQQKAEKKAIVSLKSGESIVAFDA
jgi:large subunit ribosomal protein L23